jgi:hypothetical protein
MVLWTPSTCTSMGKHTDIRKVTQLTSLMRPELSQGPRLLSGLIASDNVMNPALMETDYLTGRMGPKSAA